MHQQRSMWVLMIAAIGLALSVLPSSPAFADVCTDKDQIFWADEVSLGSWRTQAYGTTNSIRFSNRDINNDCNNYTAAWSTAHHSLGGVFGHWAEVGWRIRRECAGPPFGCQKIFYWFTEWGLSSNTHGSDSGAYILARRSMETSIAGA